MKIKFGDISGFHKTRCLAVMLTFYIIKFIQYVCSGYVTIIPNPLAKVGDAEH